MHYTYIYYTASAVLQSVAGKVLVLLHKKEFKGNTNGWRAWESSDQSLVLFCKKEFKGKANSKQGSTKFIKAKIHTHSEECELTLERESVSARWLGYELFVFPGGGA